MAIDGGLCGQGTQTEAALQMSGVLQAAPQQGWFVLPHATHVPAEQVVAAPVQVEPPQQGCPTPPQATHVPEAEQTRAALHVEPPQQGCPAPPQAPHVPEAEQTLPVLHVEPPQQSCPVPPQATQLAAALHIRPVSHVPGSEAFRIGEQVPVLQVRQVPVHALLQQCPSTQWPVLHCPLRVQA
jgi:hypothetical protein